MGCSGVWVKLAWKNFEKQKIIWGNLATQVVIFIRCKLFYINAPACFITHRREMVIGHIKFSVSTFFHKTRQLNVKEALLNKNHYM